MNNTQVIDIFIRGNLDEVRSVIESDFDMKTLLGVELPCEEYFIASLMRPIEILMYFEHFDALRYVLSLLPLDYSFGEESIVHISLRYSVEVLRVVMERPFNVNMPWSGYPPLICEAIIHKDSDRIEVYKILLERGADPYKLINGRTFVHEMITNLPLVKLFIQFDIDFNVLDTDGRTAISYLDTNSETYSLITSNTPPDTKGALSDS